jgi:phosphoglucosamine mutase
MAPRFGTDGVRGVANTDLTPSFALDLGRAAARVLRVSDVVIGCDTRRSGAMLQAAFAAGLASEGVTVHLMGVVPTPAVAHLAAVTGYAGAVISASHNPYADNGIKLFAAGGTKLADAVEAKIEAELAALVDPTASGLGIGEILDEPDLARTYRDHLVGLIGEGTLSGLSIVLDTGNGAAASLAGEIFRAAGATTHVLFDRPDGSNINAGCGATHPEDLRRVVVERGADLGLAFDGDADRLIAVDHTGNIVDGDHVMAILALDMKARGQLASDVVVVTVMTNLGFRHAMAAAGINVVETAVGDRYVLQALDQHGYSLGGEQSGHVIFRDVASTGDGMLTGLMLAGVAKRSGRALAELSASAMTRLPQVLLNHRMAYRDPTVLARLQPFVAEVEDELGDTGRVLVRASGTEPLIRVMVEAPNAEQAHGYARRLIAAIEAFGRQTTGSDSQ